jgi:periplasmic divalent cation tolerance protein
MNKMIVIYITCKSVAEAEKIGKRLMEKRLAPCFNIIPGVSSACFWPPSTGEIERANEVVLLIKTVDSKFTEIEKEVEKLHSDDVPCIFALSVAFVSKKYHAWLQKELQ